MCYQPDRVLAGKYNQDMNCKYVKRSKIPDPNLHKLLKMFGLQFAILPTHQKAKGMNPWMNGYRCGVSALRNPVTQEATAVKPWSFTSKKDKNSIEIVKGTFSWFTTCP